MSVDVVANACKAVADNEVGTARSLLRRNYPFEVRPRAAREYTKRDMLEVFIRDGFVCRYTDQRLVFVGALRLLSHLCPDEFPYHRNWRTDACHIAYWDLCPTIDHVVAITRDGQDEFENWVTTSMTTNMRMGNAGQREPRDVNALENRWDGLTIWFATQVKDNEALLKTLGSSVREWYRAANSLRAALGALPRGA
jgi:5-methylcytosine-specific restriction endonuclease McrA